MRFYLGASRISAGLKRSLLRSENPALTTDHPELVSGQMKGEVETYQTSVSLEIDCNVLILPTPPGQELVTCSKCLLMHNYTLTWEGWVGMFSMSGAWHMRSHFLFAPIQMHAQSPFPNSCYPYSSWCHLLLFPVTHSLSVKSG